MSINIQAKKRDSKGTGASRRLRRAGAVPGIIYGGGKEAVSLEFEHKALFLEFRHEAFHSSILTLDLDGKKESVLLRDYQLHPVRNTIQHIDFQRVSATERIHVRIPLHLINAETAPGVKLEGGIVAQVLTEIEIACLPRDLPEFVDIDLGSLEIGQTIHLSNIVLPANVELVLPAHGEDSPVVSIVKPRAAAAEEASTAESTEEAGDAGSSNAADAPAQE